MASRDTKPLQLTEGAVETKVNEGFWRVTAAPLGGVRIEHQVRVDAGPGLPQWLVSFSAPAVSFESWGRFARMESPSRAESMR